MYVRLKKLRPEWGITLIGTCIMTGSNALLSFCACVRFAPLALGRRAIRRGKEEASGGAVRKQNWLLERQRSEWRIHRTYQFWDSDSKVYRSAGSVA